MPICCCFGLPPFSGWTTKAIMLVLIQIWTFCINTTYWKILLTSPLIYLSTTGQQYTTIWCIHCIKVLFTHTKLYLIHADHLTIISTTLVWPCLPPLKSQLIAIAEIFAATETILICNINSCLTMQLKSFYRIDWGKKAFSPQNVL